MVSFAQLRDFDPPAWRNTSGDWARLATDTEESADVINEHGQAALEEDWTDEVGRRAGTKLKDIAEGYQDAASITHGIVSTLEDFQEAITVARRSLHNAITFATEHGLDISEDGEVTQPHGTDSEAGRHWLSQVNDMIRDALEAAGIVDVEARRELDRLARAASEDGVSQAFGERPRQNW